MILSIYNDLIFLAAVIIYMCIYTYIYIYIYTAEGAVLYEIPNWLQMITSHMGPYGWPGVKKQRGKGENKHQ